MPTNLIEQVLKTVRAYSMLKPGDSVIIAVSGGPDSIFLVHALSRLKNKLKLKSLSICNLDHGLRGEESADDSEFVKRLAGDMGLRFFYKSLRLRTRQAKSLSIEELAREERYRFFKEAAEISGANVIATGHTIDDQAETVLMRVIKGSSLKGIVGIAPARDYGDLRVIRPLIEIEKSEIVGYLDRAGVDYRIDSTNLEPVYFRNIIRKEVMPFLEKYNPRLKRSLFSLAQHLREDYDFISEAKLRMKNGKFYKASGGGVVIKIKDIALQPAAIQKEVLRDALESSGGEVKRLSYRHWKELESLVRNKPKGSSVHLPGSISVTKSGADITFARI